jgi:hypothetical protein
MIKVQVYDKDALHKLGLKFLANFGKNHLPRKQHCLKPAATSYFDAPTTTQLQNQHHSRRIESSFLMLQLTIG